MKRKQVEFEQKQSQLELKLEHDTEIMRQQRLKHDELEMKLEQNLMEVKHTYENITKNRFNYSVYYMYGCTNIYFNGSMMV